MNDWLGDTDPPRWMLAIDAGVVQADDITIGVGKPGLSPKPALVGWCLEECEAFGPKLRHGGIERLALGVDDYARILRDAIDEVDRERGVAVGALEA